MAFAIACLLLAPCCGFLQRSRPVRTISVQASWTGLYDELGRPVTIEEIRAHKLPAGTVEYDCGLREDASESHSHPIWAELEFYGFEGPEPLDNPWGHMKIHMKGYGGQREGLPRYLFHYTTSNAAAQIFESGKLLPSLREEAGDDAMEGDGVYFTSLPPWAPYDVILDNNYDGANRRRRYNESRTEAYVRIETWELRPDVEVVRANVQQNRTGPMKGKVPDVYIVPGREAFDLSKSRDTLLKTEPEAWLKGNARKKLIEFNIEEIRRVGELQRERREVEKAMWDRCLEEDDDDDGFSMEEIARLEEEEREDQLRLRRLEEGKNEELCRHGTRHRNWIYPGSSQAFSWELKDCPPPATVFPCKY